jgi:cytoskeleton protein RodZ
LTEATGVGARPTGVGASLREAREAQGLAVDDVAQQLKFAPRQIESLENERFDRLPGPTIARGMVRNYARLLKLDPEPLIQRMGPQAESVPDPAHIAERLRQEITISDGAKRSTLIYAGFSIGLLVLVGALAYEWRQQTALPEFVVPARERPQQEQPPQSAAATEPAQTAAAKQVPAPVSEPPAVAVEQKKPETVVAAAVETPLAPGMHRIVLRTEAEAWLEVKDGAGRMLISSLTPAGIERTVRGRAPFEIVIGNASFVKLTYDGKPVDLRPHIKVEVARLTLK